MTENYANDEAVENALHRYKQVLWNAVDEGSTVDEAIEAGLEAMEDNDTFQELLTDDPDDLIQAVDAELARDAEEDEGDDLDDSLDDE
ncbi:MULTISPECIES: hypothetical protein [unclassified Pseudoclavibacter]|uniref:hypothetical protein n=1 Tax=unclassified Pseudoclavibacter TaxID=2615177 RepID=UPI00130100A5|nr:MULTISPECIES: hypothetical protein [unclassified Pseudoclavibacter]KAB1659105.1 hypothetical protein F8O09_06015 [Pseudoclavibacter sp. CFCC 11306]KAB1660914.1 hypothetical protein F8O07_02770 [Pseudoclavibacter sp. CFCC 13796]